MSKAAGQAACGMCGRSLDVAADPLSGNCGGDCWGCVGALEADGFEPSRIRVLAEIKQGLRNPDGSARPYNIRLETP